MMNEEQAFHRRDRLVATLPQVHDILRGSLLRRTIRHRTGCSKCARGEGHPIAVLAIGYPGGRIRHISLRPEQVAPVRRALAHYRKLKVRLEKICELNVQLLVASKAQTASQARRSR